MEGDVPTPDGKIHVYCSTKEIRIKSDTGTGTLRFKSHSKPVCKTAAIKKIEGNQYELSIIKGQELAVQYKNVK